MIVVKVELWSAVTGQIETLGTAVIANDGSLRGKKGNYDVFVGKKPDAVAGDLNKVIGAPLRRGRVENYPRLSYNMWRLIVRALRSAFPEEK